MRRRGRRRGGGGDLLLGTHHFEGFTATHHPPGLTAITVLPIETQATWGTITADGAGTLSATTTTNENGDYHLCGFVYLTGGGNPGAEFGTLSFDVAGTTAGSIDYIVEGLYGVRDRSGTYTVDPDGTITWTIDSVLAYRGGILAGGELAVLAGSTVDTTFPNLVVLVRARAGPPSTNLSGSYFIAGLQAELGGGAYRGLVGTLSVTGTNTYSVAVQQNEDGVVGAHPAWSGTFASSLMGSVHLDAGGEVLWGAMSSDGTWGVLAGDVGGSGRPMLFFLVR